MQIEYLTCDFSGPSKRVPNFLQDVTRSQANVRTNLLKKVFSHDSLVVRPLEKEDVCLGHEVSGLVVPGVATVAGVADPALPHLRQHQPERVGRKL